VSNVNDEMMLALTNDAIREAHNVAGDNAYYLRRTVELTTQAPPAVTTLPAEVRRLYRLERTACPGSYVEWTFVRHDTANNTVILAECGEAVIAHHHIIEPDLVTDADETSFPWQHEELIVTMVMLRLAELDGSEQLLALLSERKEQLMNVFKRDCLLYERQRCEVMSTMYSRESWAQQVGGGCWP
jgi:flagellar biosynthesis regulator FlbT